MSARHSTITSTLPTSAAALETPVAQAFGLTKVYGDGPARATALDDVSAQFDRRPRTATMRPSVSGNPTPLQSVRLGERGC